MYAREHVKRLKFKALVISTFYLYISVILVITTPDTFLMGFILQTLLRGIKIFCVICLFYYDTDLKTSKVVFFIIIPIIYYRKKIKKAYMEIQSHEHFMYKPITTTNPLRVYMYIWTADQHTPDMILINVRVLAIHK